MKRYPTGKCQCNSASVNSSVNRSFIVEGGPALCKESVAWR